jgi:hypothetical protein
MVSSELKGKNEIQVYGEKAYSPNILYWPEPGCGWQLPFFAVRCAQGLPA